jgi:stress-induced morphogen
MVRTRVIMAATTKKKGKETVLIEELLSARFSDHPRQYPPQAYRYNIASIRLRVVSPSFEEKNESERYKMVAPLLKKKLPEDTWQDVTMLVLLTPDEVNDSLLNQEFEDPTPSRL